MKWVYGERKWICGNCDIKGEEHFYPSHPYHCKKCKAEYKKRYRYKPKKKEPPKPNYKCLNCGVSDFNNRKKLFIQGDRDWCIKCMDEYLPKDTVCKCPICGKTHIMKMLWKGNGMPRKYCPSPSACQDQIKEYSYGTL